MEGAILRAVCLTEFIKYHDYKVSYAWFYAIRMKSKSDRHQNDSHASTRAVSVEERRKFGVKSLSRDETIVDVINYMELSSFVQNASEL